MPRTRIKICGVCRVEDAQMAVAAGADAIGMIRVPGAGRYIELDEARAIVEILPAFVTPVLVFADAPVEQIHKEREWLDGRPIVQLNGEEDPAYIAQLRSPVIKAVKMDPAARGVLATMKDAGFANLAGAILESPGQQGGSGVGNNWELVKELLAEGAFIRLSIIAAGGLNPENVGSVVRDVRPYAVDVSSGVESVKRQKDAAKVKAFVSAVTQADKG